MLSTLRGILHICFVIGELLAVVVVVHFFCQQVLAGTYSAFVFASHQIKRVLNVIPFLKTFSI